MEQNFYESMGLSTKEASDRKKNNSKQHNTKSYFAIIASNFLTVFNIFFICIAAVYLGIAIIFDQDQLLTPNNYTFLLVAFANSMISTISEISSKNTLDRMQIVNEATYTVIRDFQETRLNSDELVCDDIVVLQMGNQVPVDAVIIDGSAEFNEALLTGESDPVKKTINDKILAGSYIISGQVVIKATAVGDDRYIQTLQSKAQSTKTDKTELVLAINRIIKISMCIFIPLAIVNIFKTFIMTHGNVVDYIREMTAPITGMIPCGMLLLTSVALSTGIIRLSRENTLIQDLYSIEMLARIDTLCLDKTGTITDGSMTVSSVLIVENGFSIDKIMGSYMKHMGATTPTSKALLNRYQDFSVEEAVLAQIPFSSATKYDALEFSNLGTFVLGAPEFVERICKHKYDQSIIEFMEKENAQSHRTLVLAYTDGHIIGGEISGVKPICVFSLKDNIRHEVRETLEWFAENGVDIKIISGDNINTVKKIAQMSGVKNYENAVSLDGKDDEYVKSVANKMTIFARVSPDQKAIIVQALKDAGHTVGVTGDGVNDILAMKKANCGIAMGEGSDAAKSAANIVLLDSNFKNMPAVVKEGRRIISNIQRSSTTFVMKTVCVGLLVLLAICLPFFNGYPFINQNIEGLSICVAGLGSILLAMEGTPAKKLEGSFLKNILRTAFPAGIFLALTASLPYVAAAFDLTVSPREMAIICMNISGIVVFNEICQPTNRYRRWAIAIVALMTLTAIIVPAVIPGSEKYFFVVENSKLQEFTPADGIFCATVVMSSIYVYRGLIKLFNKIIRHKKK